MSLLILAALVGAPASADPLILRAPLPPTASVGLAAGAPSLAAGGWFSQQLGAAVELVDGGAAVGVSAGSRTNLLGSDDRWGLDAYLAGGVAIPLIDPGLALTVTPALQGGWRGDRVRATLAIASPTQLRLTGFQAKLPVVAEPWLLFRAGSVWFGAQGGFGIAPVPGYSMSYVLQGSAVIAGAFNGPREAGQRRTPEPDPRPAP